MMAATFKPLCSGFGAYHSNETTAKKPEPYGSIDLTGIRALVDTPQQCDKGQAQWLIPSSLPSRSFKEQNEHGAFWLLWADFDQEPKPLDDLAGALSGILQGADYEAYLTRSATPIEPKARALVPLREPLSGAEWKLCQEILNDKLLTLGFRPDRVNERTAQLCYLPNSGEHYSARHQRSGEAFDPRATWAGELADKRAAIEEQAAELSALSKAAGERRAALQVGDAPDTIGAFNRAYTVAEILQRAGYTQRGNTFRHPHSESGSFSASVKDGRVHSLSSGDPLFTGGDGGGAHDPFSAFTVLWCGGDRNTALKLAGDQWLSVGGESWNKAMQREYMRRKAEAGGEHQADDGSVGAGDSGEWPEPLEIPCTLLPVAPFDNQLLPVALRAWVADIAERMQCPPDFPAVGAMVALSSVVGRKASIKPKRFDDWQVVPNLWGAIVGRPGVMKSPALSEVMKPLDRLAIIAGDLHAGAVRDYNIKSQIEGMGGKAAESKAQKLVAAGKINEAEQLLTDAADADSIKPPALRRYKVTDASVEALGEILIENPWGTLAYRDELNGLLRSLDKEGQEGARAFYLQGYDGNQGYTFDRIMRGRNLHIPAVCIAMLGGIQPGKLQAYIHDAVSGGAGDDGLLQRFGLLVWPDVSSEWRNVDRWPDTPAKGAAFDAFQRLDALEPSTDPDSGEESPTVYRFDNEAQSLFEEWRQEFETDLRSGDRHPAMESHLSKFRKLVPAVALVCALADGEAAVSLASLLRALAWSDYLRSHAERAYAAGTRPATEGAAALLAKIKARSVADGFAPRDVYLKGWAHLSTPEAVHSAASMLCDLHHLRKVEAAPGDKGGRPATSYRINPKTAGEE